MNYNWPSGYPCPTWLPNWEEEEEYKRLDITTVYEYETKEPESVMPLEPDISLTTRQIEPGTLKISESATPKADFAWEFFRRNPYYQADYRRISELAEKEGVMEHYRSGLGISIFRLDDAPPPCPSFHAELYRTLSRWGLAYCLPDPAYDLHDAAPLSAMRRLGIDVYQSVQVFHVDGEPIPLDGGIIPGDSENFWLFDISSPVEPQIHRAKAFLERAQKQQFGKPLRVSKTSQLDYIRFLRILDALATGVSDDEIEMKIFDHVVTELYHKKSQQFSNPRRDAMKNAKSTAIRLMQKDYKLILPPA